MKKTVFFTFSLLLIFAISCKNQQTISVSHVNSLSPDNNLVGYYYSLPQTKLIIEANILKTEFIPGPYAEFAEELLSIKNAKEEADSLYEISSINIRSLLVPDPEQFYFIAYDPSKGQPEISLEFDKNGILKSINTKEKKQSASESDLHPNELGYFNSKNEFIYHLNYSLTEKIDTIYEEHWVDTTTVTRRRMIRSMEKKTSKENAKEIADIILNIREKKQLLISGFSEIPYEKETVEYMYSEMNNLEKQYLELFTGITSYSIEKHSFSYIPTLKSNPNNKIFKFSDSLGIVPIDYEGGFYVEIEAEPEENIRRPHFSIHSSEQAGLYHRIAENGNIKVIMDNKIIAETNILINQFGRIAKIPLQNNEIEFYNESGSIKSIYQKENNK